MNNKPRESKRIAAISLVIMGIGFIITIPFEGPFWVTLIQGAFEAGLVGGLADWFAVTALFRHPLGIPIPHTALLPKNRERVTNGIVKMLKHDLLSKDSIQEKIKDIPFVEKISSILRVEIKRDNFKRNAVKVIRRIIEEIDVEKLTPYIKKYLEKAIMNLEIQKYLPLVLSQVLDEQVDKKVLDHVLKKARTWLSREQNVQQLGRVSMNVLDKIELDGFLQFALKSVQNLLNEEKLGNLIKNLLLSVISSLEHETEPNRKQVLSYIREELMNLSDNQDVLQGIERWKQRLLSQWNPDEEITKALAHLKSSMVEKIENEDFPDTYLLPMITKCLDQLQSHHLSIDDWLQQQIAVFIDNNHSKIGDLVKENLDKLDTETMIHMIENNVGKDLQWIRVNGAVCGFILGLILTGVHLIFNL